MLNKNTSQKCLGKSSSDFIMRVKSDPKSPLTGKIEHIQTGEVGYFQDFLEMLLLMEKKLDQIDHPQSDTELRTFND